MKLLVTGGAGFIGSHLVDLLLAKGHQVAVVDNLAHGTLDNIRHHLDNPHFAFYELNILDKESLFNIKEAWDGIVHLASLKIPRYASALNTLIENVKGTENILELAREHKTKLVFASTSDVYGVSKDLPFKEDGNLCLGKTTSRRWAYAVSKLYDEHLILAFSETYNLSFVILRFFGAYGPRQYLNWWGGPQGVFLKAIAENRPLEIHGKGTQTRCFIYIEDLVEGIYRALTFPEAEGEILNIGTDEEISILDLAKKMHALSGSTFPLTFQFIPYERFGGNYQDVLRRVPDLTKMKKILKYEPKYGLDAGIKCLWDWYKEKYGKS